VSMADGYSRMSNQVGVVSVTHGPAMTNALTALVEAVRARSPIVVMSGDTPARRDHPQNIDLRAIASIAGADYWRVRSAEFAVDDIAMILAQVSNTRTPVVFDLPADFEGVDVEYVRPLFKMQARQITEPGAEALDQALGIVASAKRPLVLGGRGVALSGAREALIQLADMIGAPLGTSLLGKDLFRRHPYNLGVIGTISSDLALETFSKADCVIAFGASLNRYTTVDRTLFRDKAVVHCDLDPRSLGLNISTRASVAGDARITAQAMCQRLAEIDHQPSAFRTQELKERLASHSPESDFIDGGTATTLDMRTAMIHLNNALSDDLILVTDCGRFSRAPWRYLHVREPTDFTHSANFTSIGLGTATAIGAAFARPDRLTIGVVGDGGGMMGMIEFTTAVRENIPFVLVVLNDGSYGAEYRKLKEHGVDPKYSLMKWPEFAEMAIAMGGDGIAVRNLDDLAVAVQMIGARTRPLLIDVKADPSVDIRSTSSL